MALVVCLYVLNNNRNTNKLIENPGSMTGSRTAMFNERPVLEYIPMQNTCTTGR